MSDRSRSRSERGASPSRRTSAPAAVAASGRGYRRACDRHWLAHRALERDECRGHPCAARHSGRPGRPGGLQPGVPLAQGARKARRPLRRGQRGLDRPASACCGAGWSTGGRRAARRPATGRLTGVVRAGLGAEGGSGLRGRGARICDQPYGRHSSLRRNQGRRMRPAASVVTPTPRTRSAVTGSRPATRRRQPIARLTPRNVARPPTCQHRRHPPGNDAMWALG